MSALPAREGYRLWAPHYDAETAVSHLEQLTVAELGVQTSHIALLDVGCGTARRLRDTDAAIAIGADLTFEMLACAEGSQLLAAADVRALPFARESFDVVWCRLVIGHVRQLETAYAELARVCRAGGTVVVSDLCPEAIDAGHRRTFRDATGAARELEHVVYTPAMHATAAGEAGLTIAAMRDGVVGPSIRDFYISAGRADAYETQRGLPLVRALAWRKSAGAAT